jgi:hypothetical protein
MLLLLLQGLIFLSSCTIERKLAGDFQTKGPQISLQLFTPDYLFKYSHKGELIDGFDTMNSQQQDSALFASSKFMQFISDSLFLEKYMNPFIDELRALGFKVYLDSSLDSLLAGNPQSYVVNIAQIQLDEYASPYEDSEPVDDTVFSINIPLNAVDASSWFELSRLNSPRPVKTILYSAFTASDGFKGSFAMDPLTGRPLRYHYKIDSLRTKDLYDLASYIGRKNASYLYDFFLNQYINIHMPEGIEMQGYLHYDRFRKTFYQTEGEQFEVLDSK